MVRFRGHRLVPVALALVLSGLAPAVGHAQDVRLLAQCSAPQLVQTAAPSPSDVPTPANAAPSTSVTCDVRSTDAVTFKSVKANIKGRTDQLDVQFEPRNQTLAPCS